MIREMLRLCICITCMTPIDIAEKRLSAADTADSSSKSDSVEAAVAVIGGVISGLVLCFGLIYIYIYQD